MPASTHGNAPSLNLNELYHVLREKWKLIISCLVLFLLGADVYLLTATPQYDAIATVEVLQKQHPVVNVDEKDQPDDYRSLDVLETVEGNLQNPSLLLQVLQLPEVRNNPYLATLAADPQNPANSRAVKGLQNSITVKLRRATRLIDITVEHPDPATAQLLANLLVSEYLHEGFLSQSGEYQNTSQFLTQEAKGIQDKLQKTETQLQDYATLVDLRQRILDERRQLDLLNERYLEKHPKVIEAHALLDSLQKQFLDEMARRRAAEEGAGIIAPANLSDETGLTNDQKVEREMVEEESRFNVLTQERTTERTVYESVLDKLKEATISQGYQDANLRVAQPALLPDEPAKPRTLLILAIAFFLGSSSGVGLALAVNSMDSSVRTIDEAEERFKLSSIGAIPELGRDLARKLDEKKKAAQKPGQNPGSGSAVVMEDGRDSIVAEAIRTLRASVKLLGNKQEPKSFLITSAVPAEGKSFVSSNLAVALVQEGCRVLLIDADLRKPEISQIFGYSRQTPGLTDWLLGSKTLSNLIQPCATIQGLDLLLAGGIAANPAELLSHGTFQRLLDSVMDQYDYILVDSAPVLAVGDTLLICPMIQTTILVVRAAQTPATAAVRALRLLNHAKAKVAGFVLNRLPQRTGFGSNPYYYYYQSTDKYGEAYGAKATRQVVSSK